MGTFAEQLQELALLSITNTVLRWTDVDDNIHIELG